MSQLELSPKLISPFHCRALCGALYRSLTVLVWLIYYNINYFEIKEENIDVTVLGINLLIHVLMPVYKYISLYLSVNS